MPIHLQILSNMTYKVCIIFILIKSGDLWASKNLPTVIEPGKGRSMIRNIFTPKPMVFILYILLYISARFLAVKTFKQPGFRTLLLDAGNEWTKAIKGVEENQWEDQRLIWWMAEICIFWPNWPFTLHHILRWFLHGVYFLKWLLSTAS